jgi:hypothetical protein
MPIVYLLLHVFAHLEQFVVHWPKVMQTRFEPRPKLIHVNIRAWHYLLRNKLV